MKAWQKWEYKGCTVHPVTLKTPKLVGRRYVRQCWEVHFPDLSWIQVASKEAAVEYIDRELARNPWRAGAVAT